MNRPQPAASGQRPELPPASQAEIDAARFYQHRLVPALFSQYASRPGALARVARGDRVLDIACGTGIVTRELARLTGPRARPVGLDIAAGMLAVAREANPAIDWCHGDALALPFADAGFDRVVCQFGLMFFTDPGAALAEMRRVLKPGGRLAVSVWDEISRNPGSAALVEILERLAGPEAANALKMPFALGARDTLERLAAKAGIDEIEIETQAGESHYPDLGVVIDAELRGWLPIMGVHLDEPLIEAIAAECERRLDEFIEAGKGAVRSPTSAHFVCGARGA